MLRTASHFKSVLTVLTMCLSAVSFFAYNLAGQQGGRSAFVLECGVRAHRCHGWLWFSAVLAHPPFSFTGSGDGGAGVCAFRPQFRRVRVGCSRTCIFLGIWNLCRDAFRVACVLLTELPSLSILFTLVAFDMLD